MNGLQTESEIYSIEFCEKSWFLVHPSINSWIHVLFLGAWYIFQAKDILLTTRNVCGLATSIIKLSICLITIVKCFTIMEQIWLGH